MKEQKQKRERASKRVISIKAKLLGVIIPVVVVLISVLVWISYQASAQIIKSYSENLLESSVGNQAAQIEAWLNENLASFQIVKTTIENSGPDDEKLQAMLDGYYNYNSNYPDGIYIADEKGKLMKASESQKNETDPVNSTWYRQGLSRVNMAFGSAYRNQEGINVISASGILNDGSGTVKVISADMSLDRVTIIVNSFIEMNDAQAFLVDSRQGTVLAHRDASMISTKLADSKENVFYQEAAARIAERDLSFGTLDGNMTVFKKVAGTDWILVSYIPTDIVLADLMRLRLVMIGISLLSILVLCVIIERITQIVIKPVKKLTSIITSMASGDFTVALQTKGRDEIAFMSRSVETFIGSMKQMIASMGNISARLKEQAGSSNQISQEMYSAANIQSETMGELNTTVDQLSLSVNEIASNATQLAGVAADTKSNSGIVEEKMRETVLVSEKGRKDMEHVGTALASIRTSIQNLETAVNKVGTASGEIVEIVQLIGNIAEETNLLSLNASIEAARAGEAGKGFAVVAAEIGKLANNSAASVSHISELIGQVSTLVSDAVKQAGDSVINVNESSELIDTAVETFDVIFSNIQQTSILIEQVAEKINLVDQVSANVAAISEEQAASSDEILATSELMLGQAKGIAENSGQVAIAAESLTESSKQLAEQVQLFRI